MHHWDANFMGQQMHAQISRANCWPIKSVCMLGINLEMEVLLHILKFCQPSTEVVSDAFSLSPEEATCNQNITKIQPMHQNIVA